MSDDTSKLLNACVEYRAMVDKLEVENAALLEDKAHLREELREANRLLVAFGPESARAARAAEKTPVGADAIMRQHLHEGGTPT